MRRWLLSTLLLVGLAQAQAPIFFNTNYSLTAPTAATPTFSPAAGTYDNNQTVTISSASGCASYIYWNTAGSPTTGSTHSASASVSSGSTLYAKVIGCPGFVDSAVGSAAYSFTVATPSFSPGGGSYSGTQSVTINDATSGATGCYTTNGADPAASTPGTCSAGTTYTGPVSVASSSTLKSLWTKAGYTNSSIGSAAYTISAGFTQVQKKLYCSSAPSATHSVTFDSAPSSGNLLILAVAADAYLTGDPSGWTRPTNGTAEDWTGTYLLYKISAGTETTTSITINSSTGACLAAFEYSGMSATPFDLAAATIGLGGDATIPSSSITTTNASDLLIAVVGIAAGDAATVGGWTDSFTQESLGAATGSGGLPKLGVASRAVSSTGGYSVTADLTGTVHNASSIIAAFKRAP